MNISEKYRTIWIAPERTGSRKLAEIFAYYDFKSEGRPVFNHNNGYAHNHGYHIDEKYMDYDVIVGLRNPYGKTYSLFKNLHGTSKDKSKEEFKKYLVKDLPTRETLKMVTNPILNTIPNYIIRLEYMEEDLLKIPFITDILKPKQLSLMTQHGKEIEDFEVYYDQESKDIVYEYCKHLFILGGYEK